MAEDIFTFWSAVKRGTRVHPEDQSVLERVPDHGFSLDCLPLPFYGRLRTARVVLLYLSPGLSEDDLREAESDSGQDRRSREYLGSEPLSAQDEHRAGFAWLASRTRSFGLSDTELREDLAVLELAPYHSAKFTAWPLLIALPSARAAVDWAQRALFPDAISGKRIVICMRSHRYWGLAGGQTYGKSLFAPTTGRGGHMAHGPLRETIIDRVRGAFRAP